MLKTGVRIAAYGQIQKLLLIRVHETVDRFFGGKYNIFRIPDKGASLHRKFDRPRRTVKQLDGQFIFQCLHLMTDGGLRDIHLLCGPCKAKMVCYRKKTFQLKKIHDATLSFQKSLSFINKNILLIITYLKFTFNCLIYKMLEGEIYIEEVISCSDMYYAIKVNLTSRKPTDIRMSTADCAKRSDTGSDSYPDSV
jgi:hypothetical protein